MEGLSASAHHLVDKLSVEKPQKRVGGIVRQEQHKLVERDEALIENHSSDTGAQPNHLRGSSVSGLGISGMETMSLMSSYSASGSDNTSEVRSHRPSQDLRNPSRSSFFDFDQPDSLAKSLLAKSGRALRHHGSKLSLASSASFDKDAESRQAFWSLSGLGARVQRQRQELGSNRSKFCWSFLE